MSAARAPEGRDAARVALVFPPLVAEGLGNYYPSTAVLAGYLASRGVPTSQANLNERFAAELLEPTLLQRIGEGVLPDGVSIGVTSMTAVAGRVLRRQALGPPVPADPAIDHVRRAAYLKTEILAAFAMNDRLDVLCGPDWAAGARARYVRDFYARSGYVEGLRPEVHTLGISVPMGPQLGPALLLAAYAKELRPDIKVLLGGPTMSLMAPGDLERLLAAHVGAVDAVVRYEGEVPLGLLVEQRDQGRWDPFVVPGVAALKDGRMHETPPAPGIRLEDLAYPEYDPALLASMPSSPIGIVQARGCYWGRCTYCDYVELYEGSPRYRTRLPESFVDEMEHQIAKHQRRDFSIVTESIPASFARKMSEAILARRLDVRWSSFAMVDRRFTVDVLETLVKGGCRQLTIGLETVNTRVLKLVEKAADREMNLEFLRCAKRVGLRLRVNLIVDLPTTTYAESLENLEVLESIRDCFEKIAVFPFEPTKSSAIGRSPGRFGLEVLSEPHCGTTGGKEYVSNRLGCIDPAMTHDEREDAHGRYFAFADSINDAALLATADPGPASSFRFAEENLDVVDVDGGLACVNWVTKKNVTLAQDWNELFRKMRDKAKFPRSWFERQFPSRAEGKRIFALLLEEYFLRPCE